MAGGHSRALCLGQVDWDQVKEKAGRFDLDTFAGPTLVACASLFGTKVPAQISCRPLPDDISFPRLAGGFGIMEGATVLSPPPQTAVG